MTRSPQEFTAQKVQSQREQEKLFKDLLGILDSLDSACHHWDQARQNHSQTLGVEPAGPTFLQPFQKLAQTLRSFLHRSNVAIVQEPIGPKDSVAEVVSSAHEGLEMIQRSLLEVLRQRQVVPIETLGQPFDPTYMYALGRQDCEDALENTVVQEVIRGYRWQNRILREAQVMVASKPSSEA